MIKKKCVNYLFLLLSLFNISTVVYSQPSNDECDNAIPITVNPGLTCDVTTAGTTVGATASPQTDDVIGSPNNDVWFSFVPTTSTHRILISNVSIVSGSDANLAFGIYNGIEGCDALFLHGDAQFNVAIFANLMVGTTYYLRVYGENFSPTANVNFDICVFTPPPTPGNDECDNAFTLVESTNSACAMGVSGTTISATQSGESILCTTNSNSDDVWYTFTPSMTTDYVFDITNTSTTVYINFYNGTCSGGFSYAAFCFNEDSRVVSLTASNTYYVHIHSTTNAETDFDLCVYPFTCEAVNYNVTTSNVTGTSVDLAWIPEGTETAWDIEVVLAGVNPTGIPTFDDVTINPFTVTGLAPSTAYDFYVRADCGMDNLDISLTENGSASTTCFAELPTCNNSYLMDFDGSSSLVCWEFASGPVTAPSGGPQFGGWTTSSFANTGSSSGSINLYNLGTQSWFLSPQFDLTGPDNFNLKFDIALTEWNNTNSGFLGSDDEVQLLISTDNGSSWNNLLTWNNNSVISNTSESITIDLSAYNGVVQFGFWATEGTVDDAEDMEFYFDNFTVECIPPCPDDYANGNFPNSQPALQGSLNMNADYEADKTIVSTQIIGDVNNAIDVDYDSGTDIILNPGFEVKTGVLFDAFIDGCGGNQ